ncbi:hypothetical protein NIES4073_35970 [Kalymmatonema gypsitolerans NIES-4073]|nr:hypothetical protein NIES4073_35970 [Scytonema sp. NIES-4073]
MRQFKIKRRRAILLKAEGLQRLQAAILAMEMA